MNPLTQVKQTQIINQKEALLGLGEDASWHARFKDSAYVFVGGIPYDLTEGDLLAVFAQYGEVVDVNLVRDKGTGKSKGFAFLAYEDQRSTILAVDNLNGAKVLGRIIRVDHVSKYKKKEEEDEEELQKKREERGVCYAFQKGECNRGASCRFSHDEQRNANTGWGSKEESGARWEHDKYRGLPKSHKRFPTGAPEEEDEEQRQKKREARGVCYAFQKGECNRGASCRFSHDEQRNINTHRSSRDGESSRSEQFRDRDSRNGHNDRSDDRDRYRRDKSPERSRGERHRNDDRYVRRREERSPERSRGEKHRHKYDAEHDDIDRKRSRYDKDSERHEKRW